MTIELPNTELPPLHPQPGHHSYHSAVGSWHARVTLTGTVMPQLIIHQLLEVVIHVKQSLYLCSVYVCVCRKESYRSTLDCTPSELQLTTQKLVQSAVSPYVHVRDKALLDPKSAVGDPLEVGTLFVETSCHG